MQLGEECRVQVGRSALFKSSSLAAKVLLEIVEAALSSYLAWPIIYIFLERGFALLES